MFMPLYLIVILPQLLKLHSAFHEVVQFVITDIGEHYKNHIEVVCTLHCQILYHDYQLSQYNVTELF